MSAPYKTPPLWCRPFVLNRRRCTSTPTVIGSPTYNTEIFPPVAAVVSALAGRGIKNKVVASFGGFSWASAAAKKINDSFDALKLENAGSVNMKHSITPEVEEQVKELAKNFVELLNK